MYDLGLERILRVVKKYLKILSGKIEINEAYLFGSYAKGTWLKTSDIDLIIISEDFQGLSMNQRLELLYSEQWKYKISPFIEIIPLTPKEFQEKKRDSVVIRDAKKYWIKIR